MHISSTLNYQLPSKERRRTVPVPMKPLGSEHELWVLLVSCRLHVIQRQAGEALLVCGKFARDGQELVLPILRRPFRMVICAEDLDSSRMRRSNASSFFRSKNFISPCLFINARLRNGHLRCFHCLFLLDPHIIPYSQATRRT